MFDVGPTELLLIVVVAILVIGPKDMPLALRTAGRWIGKMRRLSGHFRSGLDAMIREAEMAEMEQKWREQNEKIMRHHPSDQAEMEPTGAYPPALPPAEGGANAEAVLPPASAEAKPAPEGQAPAEPRPDPAPERDR